MIIIERELERIKEIERRIQEITKENLEIMTALNAEEEITVEKEGDKRTVVRIDENGIRDIYIFIPEQWKEYESFQRGPGSREEYYREAKITPLSEEEKQRIITEYKKEIEEGIERLKLFKKYGRSKEQLRELQKENNRKADMLRKEIENTSEAKALMKISTDDMLIKCYQVIDPVNKLNYGWNVKYDAIIEALLTVKQEKPELFEEVREYLKDKYSIEIE